MRIRQILLVHPNRSIRALIKKYLFAELSDVEIVETDDAENTLAELDRRPFHVVIATACINDMPTMELKHRSAATGHNSITPFIVLSEDDNGEDQEYLVREGFEHVVRIRVCPSDLIHKINVLCNPRKWRKDKRYCIPLTRVGIHVQGTRTEGSLINISRGGVLVEIVTRDVEALLRSDIHMTLHLPGEAPLDEIGGLTCRLLNLNVTAWHSDNKPAAMRVTFTFLNLAAEQIRQIEQILRFAKEDTLENEII
jgi:DNA-binding response OmpR family regulator